MLVTRPSQASHAESELAGCGDEILVRIMLSYLFSRAHKDMDKKQHPLCPFYFHIIPGKHQSFCFGQLTYPATSAGCSIITVISNRLQHYKLSESSNLYKQKKIILHICFHI